jgi:hypothetical protein
VEEIVKMAEKGKVDQIEKVTERMNSQLLAVATLELNGGTLAEEKGMLALQAPTSTTNATASNVAPFIRLVPAPTIIVTETPAPSTRTQGPHEEFSSGQADNAQDNNNELNDKEKLKALLLKKAEQNLQILKDQLEKAPEALKPALLKAIEIAEQGYAQALANLE